MRRTLIVVLASCTLLAALAAPASAQDDVDPTHLPVGETVTTPTVGGLWSCQTSSGGGGAESAGPWFNGDGTYDSTTKLTVDGSVEWPDAKLTIKKQGSSRVITTNDLPTDHTTGVFPISSSDDAYQYDKNPNSIKDQSITVTLPLNPKKASSPTCVAGEVGVLKSGVVLFDAVDAGGRDAVAYEVQDDCQGHPQVSGEYHYHSVSKCVLADLDKGKGQSKLIGYAFDGFGIYGSRGANGTELTNADLDACHGTTSTVVFNGKKQKIYHYVATQEYPYTVGCFTGTSAVNGPTVQGGGPPPG